MIDKKKSGKKPKDKQRFRNRKNQADRRNEQIDKLANLYQNIDPSCIEKFSDFPLSTQTLEGLKKAKYFKPTEIQRESIGLTLKGCDILGAAKTGSGKTLAFVVPILECLYRNRWSQLDGLGAMVISPTRELALQTYEVLRTVGCKHDFSAALIIGGTDVNFEKERIARSNIVICTPGRILQHMDENPTFFCDSLQLLVLDEADRILDLGFKKQLNALIENLPSTRQTLLFSATQTKSVKDLARLSLKDPMYVSVHEHAEYSTPSHLKQSYVICEEENKLNLLWSFIRNHLQSKILVFFSNCKQVRFVFEAFCHLRPGMSVMCLHGSMNQMKRVEVYEEFSRKQRAVLFATDVAARGLDFPGVSWVFQLDCPPDAVEYIHRSGRTARFQNEGQSLLVLTPSQEKSMIVELEMKKIPISRIKVNCDKLYSVQKKLEILCARDNTLKTYAQRAFVAYIRSIFVMSNKSVFDINSINNEELAKSYGLVNAPRIRFLRKNEKKEKLDSNSVNDNNVLNVSEQPSTSSENVKNVKGEEIRMKFETVDDDSDEFLTVKKRDVFKTGEPEDEPIEKIANVGVSKLKREKPLSKVAAAKKLLKKNIRINKKIVFADDDDEQKPSSSIIDVSDEPNDSASFIYNIEEAKQRMVENDKIDRQLYRQKIKAKHRDERQKLKQVEATRRKQPVKRKEDEVEVFLGNPNSNEDDEQDDQASSIDSRNYDNNHVTPDLDGDDDEAERSEAFQPPNKKLKITKNQKRAKNVPTKSKVNLYEEIALDLLENV